MIYTPDSGELMKKLILFLVCLILLIQCGVKKDPVPPESLDNKPSVINNTPLDSDKDKKEETSK